MSIRHSNYIMSGDGLFAPSVPINVNRVYETFELNSHSHDFFEITYISEGEGVHYIDDEAVPVEQGTIIFIPVGCAHVYRPKTLMKDRPLIVYNCLFQEKYLTELHSCFPQAPDICEYFANKQLHWFSMKDLDGTYHSLFRELYREFATKPPGYLAALSALVMQILIGLFRHQVQNLASQEKKTQWMAVDEAITFINSHYASGLRLSEIADRANLSKRHFSRLFQEHTGMSFTNYLQNLRMDAACRLLSKGHSSVAEIAASVGYVDMKFFHQLFKKKVGMTPLAYRHTWRQTK